MVLTADMMRTITMNNLNDIFFTPASNDGITYDQVLEDVQRYFSENHASCFSISLPPFHAKMNLE